MPPLAPQSDSVVMSLPTSPARRWQPWLLGFAVWTVLGLLSAVQTSIYFMRDGRPVPWTPVVIDRLADWYTCAIFTPLFFWIVRAIPWERSRWWRSVSLQTLVALACVPIKYLMYAGIVAWLIPDYRSAIVGNLIVSNIVTEFMAFAAMFAVIHAVEFNRRAMEDTARAARLETRLAEARLEILTAQLQPHFLFNTLHAIRRSCIATSTRPTPCSHGSAICCAARSTVATDRKFRSPRSCACWRRTSTLRGCGSRTVSRWT